MTQTRALGACIFSLGLAIGGALAAQTPAKPAAAPAAKSAAPAASGDAELRQRLAAFFQRVLGYQGLDKIEVVSISPPDGSGLRIVNMHFVKGADTLDKHYTISADGKEIIEGGDDGTEVSTLSGDPWAATRAKLQLQGAPAIGPANAPVTIVEFSDLQCPYCKQESQTLSQLMAKEPGKVRLIFKINPLVKIHPWSMQAALDAVCTAQQGSDVFWHFEQAAFDHQAELDGYAPDLAKVTARLHDFAVEAGAKAAALDSCLSSPEAQAAVAASLANGKEVGVASTPTLYINGREIPGAADEPTLELLVNHELKMAATATAGGIQSGPKGPQCSGDCKPLAPLPARGGGGGN